MNDCRPVFARWRATVLALTFLAAVCPRIDAATVGYWRFESAAFLQDSGANTAGPFTLTNAGGDNTNDSIALPATGAGATFPRTVPGTGVGNLGAARFTAAESPADSFGTPHQAALDSQSFTIEAFVNLASEPGVDQSRTIASIYGAATTDRQFRLAVAGASSTTSRPSGALMVSLRTNFATGTAGGFTLYLSSSSLLLTVGQDYYVAVTVRFTGSSVQIGGYVKNLTTNGSLLQQPVFDNSSYLSLIYSTTAPFQIGAATNTATGELAWDGVIDEVRYSNTVLAQSEFLVSALPVPATLPTITTQPASQTATAGETVSFTLAATGSPTPTIQWRRNGGNISGATSSTLTLPGVTTANAGSYTAVISNSAGSVTTEAATLTVNAVTAPVISAQPVSQTSAGGTVVFSVVASLSPAPTYQWRKDGVNIAGAIASTLVIQATSAASAGNYSVVVTNTAGSVTSGNAALTLTTSSDPGRLTNLSVLTDITAAGQNFTIGTVIGGSGTSGTKALVVRAVGPSLGAFGVPSTIDDPKLDLFAGLTVVATNDNWGSDTTATAALTNAMASVGAFAFTGATSKDAAVYLPSLTARDYTVQVTGVNGAIGTAIAEIYDATPAGAYTAATPRLTNVSVLKQIGAGGSLTLGFTVGGSTAKTVLIRVIGPGLSVVGLTSGTLTDPQLTLSSSNGTVVATNDDWGADPQLISAGTSVNAFAIGSTSSKDAMMLITLPAGGYTAQAKGGGNSSGYAIVEVYEVP